MYIIGSVFEESSYRALQQYNVLCSMKHTTGKSVCETGDETFLKNIIKTSFIDHASNGSYNFDRNPPVIDGQVGVPQTVDRLLGNNNIHRFKSIVCQFFV